MRPQGELRVQAALPTPAAGGEKAGLFALGLDIREIRFHDKIFQLEISAVVAEAGDLRGQHQLLDPALEAVGFPFPFALKESRHAGGVTFFEPLDLHFSQGLANPLRRVWLTGLQENLRLGLREYRLRFRPVKRLNLLSSVKAQDQAYDVRKSQPCRSRTHSAALQRA